MFPTSLMVTWLWLLPFLKGSLSLQLTLPLGKGSVPDPFLQQMMFVSIPPSQAVDFCLASESGKFCFSFPFPSGLRDSLCKREELRDKVGFCSVRHTGFSVRSPTMPSVFFL